MCFLSQGIALLFSYSFFFALCHYYSNMAGAFVDSVGSAPGCGLNSLQSNTFINKNSFYIQAVIIGPNIIKFITQIGCSRFDDFYYIKCRAFFAELKPFNGFINLHTAYSISN